MIKPDILGTELPYGPWSCRGCDVWDAITAAVNGDAPALGRLPLHRAVAASAREVIKLLLDRGADIHALHGLGAWRCTRRRAQATVRWWSCSSRTAPIPTAGSIRPETPRTPPAALSCARCCSRAAARSAPSTWSGWARTTRCCAASPPTRARPTPAAAACTRPPASQHLREGRGLPVDAARVGGAQRPAGHGRVAAGPGRGDQPRGRRAVGHPAHVGDQARTWSHRRDPAAGRRDRVSATP